jgi:hypothetical protein
MENQVIVALATGRNDLVIESRNNPENGAIMLRSEVMTINDNGFQQVEKRVGLLKGKTADLKALIAKHNLKAGDDFSKISPVRLVVRESTEPFFEGQEPKINPTTKETVTHLGADVYRQTFVVSASSTLEDLKLATDREEAPVAAQTVFAKQAATK